MKYIQYTGIRLFTQEMFVGMNMTYIRVYNFQHAYTQSSTVLAYV